ncbi:hypothetical protein ABBQ38_009756 [Trebouxia sp. C0009 RCD-2024]
MLLVLLDKLTFFFFFFFFLALEEVFGCNPLVNPQDFLDSGNPKAYAATTFDQVAASAAGGARSFFFFFFFWVTGEMSIPLWQEAFKDARRT